MSFELWIKARMNSLQLLLSEEPTGCKFVTQIKWECEKDKQYDNDRFGIVHKLRWQARGEGRGLVTVTTSLCS